MSNVSSQSTVIHFIRHGEVNNPQNIRYGRLPGFHLNRFGREQIEQAAHVLTGFPILIVYTSPLERTQQTATLLAMAHPHAPIVIDDRLNENQTAAELEGKSRNLAFVYPLEATPDAETSLQIINRMLDFCGWAWRKHPGEHILAISHGDPISLLYHWVMFGDSSNPSRYIYPGYGSDWRFYWNNHQCQYVISTVISQSGTIRQ